MSQNAREDFGVVVKPIEGAKGTVTFKGDFVVDPQQGVRVMKAINDIVSKGVTPALHDLNLIPYYSQEGKTLTLRFRKPGEKRISEPMATIEVQDAKAFTDKKIVKLMNAFADPDSEEHAPLTGRTSKKRTSIPS